LKRGPVNLTSRDGDYPAKSRRHVTHLDGWRNVDLEGK
jgi:hypothetical protein